MFRLLSLQNSASKQQEILKLIHKRVISRKFDHLIPERLKPLWHHPAGPQTIFFWAPVCKWGLVFAGLADLKRDPSTISVTLPLTLAVTGVIWCRHSLITTPKNYFMFSVNFFLALVNIIQLYRVFIYTQNKRKKHVKI